MLRVIVTIIYNLHITPNFNIITVASNVYYSYTPKTIHI